MRFREQRSLHDMSLWTLVQALILAANAFAVLHDQRFLEKCTRALRNTELRRSCAHHSHPLPRTGHGVESYGAGAAMNGRAAVMRRERNGRAARTRMSPRIVGPSVASADEARDVGGAPTPTRLALSALLIGSWTCTYCRESVTDHTTRPSFLHCARPFTRVRAFFRHLCRTLVLDGIGSSVLADPYVSKTSLRVQLVGFLMAVQYLRGASLNMRRHPNQPSFTFIVFLLIT